jgi:hypothetical protein
VDEGQEKIQCSDISVLGSPPLWLPFGPLWVQLRPFGAHRVDEGRGKIKCSDISVLGSPPLWLPFGPLWVQWRPFGAHRVDEGRGKITFSDTSVIGSPGCHSAHCGYSGGRLGRIGWRRGGEGIMF